MASALARPWLDVELAGSAPNILQLVAHALLLQDIVGVEPLSAGIWYVAVDFQLYTMLALLLWLGRTLHVANGLPALPLLFVAVSLLGNTAWVAWELQGPMHAWTMAFVIHALSLTLALVFERQVERRLAFGRSRNG